MEKTLSHCIMLSELWVFDIKVLFVNSIEKLHRVHFWKETFIVAYHTIIQTELFRVMIELKEWAFV